MTWSPGCASTGSSSGRSSPRTTPRRCGSWPTRRPTCSAAIGYPEDRYGVGQGAVAERGRRCRAAAAHAGDAVARPDAARSLDAPNVLALHKGLVSPAVVRAIHARGATVLTWTVNDPALVAPLSAAGRRRDQLGRPGAWCSLSSRKRLTRCTQVLRRVPATLVGAREAPPFHRCCNARPPRCRDALSSGALAAPASSGSRRLRDAAAAAKTGTQSHKAPAKPVHKKIVVTLPPSVRIAGVRVGRLVPTHAEKVVQKAFNKPLTVQIDKLRLRRRPEQARDARTSTGAVGHARAAKPGTNAAARRQRARRPRSARGRGRSPTASTASRRRSVSCCATASRTSARAPTAGTSTRTSSCGASCYALNDNTRLPVRVTTTKLMPQALPSAKARGDRHQPQRQHALALPRHQAVEDVPRRDRPVRLPDAARPLRHRRQVGEPVVVPAELGVGGRREPRSARPGQPARHALDGPLVARRRHPRHAEPGQHRLQRVARLHPHARSRRPSGCSTTSTSARRSSSSDARGSPRSAPSPSCVALLGVLVWDLAHDERRRHREEGRPGPDRRRARLHAAARRHLRER